MSQQGTGETPGASQQAKEAASTAAAKSSEVAGTAKEGTKQVASEATQQAGQVAQEVSVQARELVGQARNELRDQASQQTGRAADKMRTLSEQVQALTDGRPEEAGPVGDYARQAGDKLQQVASRLDEGGLEGMFEDVQGFARRRPGVFLAGAAMAGFAVGRMLRGAQSAAQGQSQGPDGMSYPGGPDSLAGVGAPSPAAYGTPPIDVAMPPVQPGLVDPVTGPVTGGPAAGAPVAGDVAPPSAYPPPPPPPPPAPYPPAEGRP